MQLEAHPRPVLLMYSSRYAQSCFQLSLPPHPPPTLLPPSSRPPSCVPLIDLIAHAPPAIPRTHIQGGRLVVYGCLSGKPPVWPWQAWVFRGLQVRGCNLRKELAADTPAGAARMRKQLATLGALVAEHTLELDFAEYNLDELYDALEHAQEAPGSARVLLRCGEHASRDGRGSDEASAQV